MRIIFVSNLTLWSMGKKNGGPAFTKTVKKYIDEGCDVYLITDVKDNNNYDELDKSHNIILEPSFFHRYIGVRKIGLFFRYLDHMIISSRYKKEIARLVDDTEDVILYAYEIYGVKACAQIAKGKKIPLVTRFQGTILSQYENNWKNRIKRYPHYQAIAERADLVVMTDDGTQGDRILEELGNNSKILFLRNGLDLISGSALNGTFDRDEFRKEQFGVDISECIFLTVSRLVGWKKVDRAIKGFHSFAKLGGKGKLIIVGDGDEKKRLQNLAEQYDIADRVIFVGAIEHDRVYNYMRASDVFMSLYDLSNVGNPLLEAMTLGCCVVTLNVGDTYRIIEDKINGRLLELDELDRLGEIMHCLANDVDIRRKFGQEAQAFARKNFYTWEERMDVEFQSVKSLL